MAMPPINEIKMGRKPAVHDPRVPRLGDFLGGMAGAGPVNPPARSWFTKDIAWGMMLNDRLGDCVIADAGHQTQVWTTAASGVTATIPDDALLKAYEDVGHYNPNDPASDAGCIMSQAMAYRKRVGIGGHKIIGAASVNWLNLDQIRTAINLFGCADLGVMLPISAYYQLGAVWKVAPGALTGNDAANSWGPHALSLYAYDDSQRLLYAVTWGAIQKIDYDWLPHYVEEAYAVLSREWINRKGFSPGHVKLDQLLAKLQATK